MCVSYRADHSGAGGSLGLALGRDGQAPSLRSAAPRARPAPGSPRGGSVRGAHRRRGEGARRVAGPARPRASPAPGRSWRGRSSAALGSAPPALGFTFRGAGRAHPPPPRRRLPAKVGAAVGGAAGPRGAGGAGPGPGRAGDCGVRRGLRAPGRGSRAGGGGGGGWAFPAGSCRAPQFQEREDATSGGEASTGRWFLPQWRGGVGAGVGARKSLWLCTLRQRRRGRRGARMRSPSIRRQRANCLTLK